LELGKARVGIEIDAIIESGLSFRTHDVVQDAQVFTMNLE
jgi:hypothetical protein